MNDCVTKPVDPEKLKSVLVRWVKTSPDSTPPVTHGPTQNRERLESGLPESIPGVDMASALKRLMGNRKLFEKLLRDFVQGNAHVVDKIRKMVEIGEYDSARVEVHTLKGVAGNLSAEIVFKVTQELEVAIRERDRNGIDSNLDRLEKELRPLVTTILHNAPSTECPKTDSVSKSMCPASDTAVIGPLMKDLDERLKKNNLNARLVFDSLKEKLNPEWSNEHLRQVESCISRLDFKGAREHLAEVCRNLNLEVNV
jgi:two-component system, sensor histidine kinase and response regulator